MASIFLRRQAVTRRLLTLVLLVFAAALLAAAAASAGPTDEGGGDSPPSEQVPLPSDPRDDPLLEPTDTTESRPDPEQLERLAAKAMNSKAGAVNVIVGLRMVFVPEGLLDEGAVERQHKEIAALQEAVLEGLDKEEFGLSHRYETVPYLALSVSPAALERLSAAEAVASIVEDGLEAADLGTSVPQVGGNEAHLFNFFGQNQTVAIIDSGVDNNHPMLAGRVVREACFALRWQWLWQTMGDCPGNATTATGAGAGVPCTAATNLLTCDHGTHVAGIAAGRGNAPTFPAGVAPFADVISIQVFHRENDATTCTNAGTTAPCMLTRQSDNIAALEHVFNLRNQHTIVAANLSFGGGSFTTNCNTDPRKMAIDNLRSVRIATVASSGNAGLTNALGAPACVSTAISVGSVNANDAVVGSSNSASFLSLLAPGGSILSSIPGGGVGTKGGTSMAAPHVTGAFAILRQGQPNAIVSNLLSLLQSSGRAVTDPKSTVTTRRIRIFDALAQLGLLRRTYQSYRTTMPDGGVASQGIGLGQRLGGSGSGSITINTVPLFLKGPQPVVIKAFLYWATIGGADPNITFNGTNVAGTLLGATPDTDWGLGANRVYRADVTSLVPAAGNGTYGISGVNPPTPGQGQGASLVLVWTMPGNYLAPPNGPNTTIAVVDGAQELRTVGQPMFGHSFGNFSMLQQPSSIGLHLGVGDGQPWPEQPIVFANANVTGSNPFAGSDGAGWDDLTLSPSPSLLGPGTWNVPLNLATSSDSLLWTYSALEVQEPGRTFP
jgi:subtilisin